MINTKTLASHYPSPSSLTATQLISLHLVLNRPSSNRKSLDPLFGPYISVLPRDFESHPLTWLLEQDAQQESIGTKLLECLPPSATTALRDVFGKFLIDWKAVRHYMVCLREPSQRLQLTFVTLPSDNIPMLFKILEGLNRSQSVWARWIFPCGTISYGGGLMV